MFDLCSSIARECQVCKPRPQFRTVQDHGLTESPCKVTEPPDAGARRVCTFIREHMAPPEAASMRAA